MREFYALQIINYDTFGYFSAILRNDISFAIIKINDYFKSVFKNLFISISMKHFVKASSVFWNGY